MMKRIGWLAGMVQLLMVAALSGLEYLSGKRGGLNHHVLARKHQWSQGLMRPERLQQLDILLGVTALLLTAVLIAAWFRPSAVPGSDRAWRGSLLLALCFTALTFASYHLPFFQQLRVSSYGTLVFAAATLLQLGHVTALALADSMKPGA